MRNFYYETIPDYMTSKEMPIGFHFADGMDTTLHKHEFIEIFVITYGQIQHKTEGQPVQNLSQGDIVIIPENVCHTFIREKTNTCGHRDIIIKTDFFNQILSFFDSNLYETIVKNKQAISYKLNEKQLTNCNDTINYLTKSFQVSYEKTIQIIKSFIIQLLTPLYTKKLEQNLDKFPLWFSDLLENFNKNAYIKGGLSVITRDIPYDKKYMCRVFKAFTGFTMTEYLNNIRLNYSLSLLQNSNMSILEISQEVGFNSLSYFTKIFKEKYGLSPYKLKRTAFKNKKP